MERLLLFANRYAGALARLGGVGPLVRGARAAGLEPEIVYTRSTTHLRHLLRDHVVGREKRVAIAGGDGTLHAAVQVLAGTDVTLGIIPQGTANNFATALRLPQDLAAAFRVIAEGEERAVDLGLSDGEYFTEAAGVGIFAETLALAGSGRRTKQFMRAMATIARLVLTHEPQRLTLTIDGEQCREDAVNVTVANGALMGMNIPIAPDARLTDALLDVVIIGALTRAEMLPYFRAVWNREHQALPKVRCLRAREVRIGAPRPRRVHVDERTRKKTPVTIRVAPAALRVMVDRL